MQALRALIFSCVFASASLLNFARQLLHQQELESTDPGLTQGSEYIVDPTTSICRGLAQESEYITDWVSYGSGLGVTVYGFPSKGGIYILHDCLGVELDFLRHDRFQDTPRPSKSDPDYKAKEDAHCDDMRRLGATWWRSLYLAIEEEMTGESAMEEFTRVGWPASGGVWVLHYTAAEARNLGAGIIHNANSMEERCKVIEQLGGIFYADPKECPYLDLP